jgi:hypothetical protein
MTNIYHKIWHQFSNNIPKWISIAFIFFGFIFNPINIKAQESFDKAEALYIYNFTRHIGWPMASMTGDFLIGVLGDKSLYEIINALSTDKSVGIHPIVVKYFDAPSEIINCHILVIGAKYRSKTEDIKSSYGNYPTLLVNAGESRITKVSCVGFRMVDDKMKFEMYRTNIKNAGLIISAQQEKWAIILD